MGDNEDSCEHIHWCISGSNLVGVGYCYDCKKDITLDILFNNLHEKMEEALKKLGNNEP